MTKVIELRPKRCPSETETAELSFVEEEICRDEDLRNLIDVWIVPKMVEEWIAQATAKPIPTDDNGEHK